MATHIVTTKTLVCGTVALVLNAAFAWGAVESTAYLPPERGLAVQLLAQAQQQATPAQRRLARMHISQGSAAALVE